MTTNENGVYFDYRTETVAACGRARAEVKVARCDDGLYRYSLDVRYSYGGFSGPITDHGNGYATHEQAKAAGIAELLERVPTAWGSEPQSVRTELQ